MDNRIKHLEMIQGIITRLANNSFAYKGWAITLVAAVFALSAKNASPYFLVVALIPTLAFWGLDSYYLRQERLFRELYDDVRKTTDEKAEDPFSMNTKPFNDKVDSWSKTCWSKSIIWLYGPMSILIVFVATLAYIFHDC